MIDDKVSAKRPAPTPAATAGADTSAADMPEMAPGPRDPLSAARGIMLGLVLGIVAWIALFGLWKWLS